MDFLNGARTQDAFGFWFVKNMTYAEDTNQMEVYYERYFNETIIGSWCTFWTSDKKMEP
jgi:hypothetical protein